MFSLQIVRSASRTSGTRLLSTEASKAVSSEPSTPEPNTHYRITLLRSAIALPDRFKGTLVALGIHRRLQTVYHPHTPEFAGMILRVKELVEVQNVPASRVRTKTEQRWERRPQPGFRVVEGLKDRQGGHDSFLHPRAHGAPPPLPLIPKPAQVSSGGRRMLRTTSSFGTTSLARLPSIHEVGVNYGNYNHTSSKNATLERRVFYPPPWIM